MSFVDANGKSCLMSYLRYGKPVQVHLITMLVRHGNDLMAVDSKQWSVLMHACSNPSVHPHILEHLIKQGCPTALQTDT
jgi:hypothetical protein